MNWPVVVRRSRALSSRAMPKSMTFASPVGQPHDVGRLHVAVDDAPEVRVVEGARHLRDEGERDRPLERAGGGQVGERLPAHELEGDEQHAGGRVAADVVDHDDARVLQGGRDPRLGQEALLEDLRRLPLRGRLDDLEGDGPVEGRVVRLVDDAHGPATDLAQDLVTADRRRSARHAPPAG